MNGYFSFEYLLKTFPILLSYAHISIIMMLASFFFGTLIGIVGALIRINKIPVLNQITIVYTSFVRGVPLLVLLFLIYFGLPGLLVMLGFTQARDWSPLFYVIVVLSVFVGGYTLDIMRGAILAVPKGQMEAAWSTGMSGFQAYRKVIFPQAFRLSIPPLFNQAISALKGTAIVFNVGVVDMMSKGSILGSNSYRNVEIYVNIAIIYGIIIFAIGLVQKYFEKRLSVSVASDTGSPLEQRERA